LKTIVLLEWVIAFTIIILNFFSCTLFRYGQGLPTSLALDSAMLSRSETLEFAHCRIFAAASNSRARPFTHFPEPPASTNVLQTRNEGNPSDGRSSGKKALDAGKKEEQRTTELQTILEVGTKTTELPASSVTPAAILSRSLSSGLRSCIWETLGLGRLVGRGLVTYLPTFLPTSYLPTNLTHFLLILMWTGHDRSRNPISLVGRGLVTYLLTFLPTYCLPINLPHFPTSLFSYLPTYTLKFDNDVNRSQSEVIYIIPRNRIRLVGRGWVHYLPPYFPTYSLIYLQ
jgi:hypothetical protein